MADGGVLAARSAATRTRLVAEARRLFGERGFAATSVEDIVRAAGVTRGALYHHFAAGKPALFTEVVEQVEAEFARRSVQAARDAAAPLDALFAGAEAYLDACMEPDLQRIGLIDAPSVLGWDAWHEICGRYNLAVLEAGLRRAMDAAVMRDGDVRALAHLVHGACVEAGLALSRAADQPELRRAVGTGIRRLIEGLA